MKRLLGLFSGGVWPIVILLLLVLGLIFICIEFNKRGNAIAVHEQEMKDLKLNHQAALGSAIKDTRNCRKEIEDFENTIEKLHEGISDDSLNFAKTILSIQSVVVSIKKDRDYWKDFAEKLQTGDFCVEEYGLFKKKTRLVPRKNTRNN